MCAGAIAWAQTGKLVFGAEDEKRGYQKYAAQALHPKTIVVKGVLADECAALMKEFFAAKSDNVITLLLLFYFFEINVFPLIFSEYFFVSSGLKIIFCHAFLLLFSSWGVLLLLSFICSGISTRVGCRATSEAKKSSKDTLHN